MIVASAKITRSKKYEGGGMNCGKPIVFLVDDDPAILKVLPRALRRHGLEVEAFSSAAEFLAFYSNTPGCLVLDLSMPGMTGLELQDELTRRQLNIPIIFITGHGGVRQSVQALKAGAIDFLEKPFLPEVLLQRIDEALLEDSKSRSQLQLKKDKRALFAKLTERELDVFHLLYGAIEIPSNKEIARKLGISHRTVEQHRSRILDKTRTKSVSEVLALAHEVGIEAPVSGETRLEQE